MEKAKILIVEDDTNIATEIKSQLQNLGYEMISIVDTSDKTIEKVEEDKPDLILMDVRIKGNIDTIEAVDIIRSRFGIPIVFSMAQIDEEKSDHAKYTMPFGYLLKPIQERDLKKTIEMVLYAAKVDKEKKEIEETLRISEKRNKGILNILDAGVVVHGADTSIISSNPKACNILGLTEDQVRGKEIIDPQWQFIYENGRPVPLDDYPVSRVFVTKKELRNIIMGINRPQTNDRVWVLINGFPVFDTNKEIKEVIINFIDITERKQAEEALKESEFLFSQMFEQSTTSTCLYNPQGTIIKVNPDFCKMFGVEEEKITDGRYNVFKDQAAKKVGIIPLLKEIFEEKKTNQWEFNIDVDASSESTGTLTSKSGQIDLEVFGYPIMDSEGNLKYVVLQHYDITERKQAEKTLQKKTTELSGRVKELNVIQNALSESETKYKSLFDNMLNGIALHEIIVDKNNQPIDYVFKEINASFENITGLTKNITIGKRVTEIIPNIREDKTKWIDIYGKVALGGKSIVMESFTEQLNRWYNISAFSPQKGYFAVAIEEITDRKNVEMEREVLIKDLESKNAELERFTYTVSHDLKSPLITIKGFLGMLTKDAAQGNIDRMKGDINRISKAADKMQDMLDELLELSRIGRIVNPPVSMLFKDLAQKAVDMVAGRLREKNIKIEIDPTPVEIKGDISRLSEVLENLVDNAAKFSGNQEQVNIKIGTRRDADKTIYFVQDNGIGINPDYQEKVFGLFEKLDLNIEGTGIGLAIVKRVVDVHGGRIWIESKGEGKGTTFCFTIAEISNKNKE